MKTRLFLVLAAAFSAPSSAQGQLLFDRPPINYSSSTPEDPIAALGERLQTGEITLDHDPQKGYLLALLSALNISPSSQTLVYSKTSLQRQHISPASPRAIYFNDETYVAWIPGADLLEIATTDPMLGSTFYTIDQDSPSEDLRIKRHTTRCLFCHASSDTGRIPGLMMRSVFTNADGRTAARSDSPKTSATGPLESRWGGWFVTGTHGKQVHLGNLAGVSGNRDNITDLSKWFDTAKYPAPHSDLVALLVLQHQVTMHNRLTDANFRARRCLDGKDSSTLNKKDSTELGEIAESLVEGLLMVDDVVFSEPVSGTSQFAQQFPKSGPHDKAGRSLRDFDLQRRLFRYPCSYLIYSPSFDALPAPLQKVVFAQLGRVLAGEDTRAKFAHLSPTQREAIRQILKQTKPTANF